MPAEMPDVTTTAKQAVVDLITKLREAGDFAIEQAPDVVRQMVTYEATMAWLGVALGIALVGGTIYAAKLVWAASAENVEDRIFMIFGFLPLIGGTAIFCCNLATAIQATFFQKWFIVSRLVEIIK